MPRIPGISPNQAPGLVSQPSANAEMYGAGIGQGMSHLGGVLTELGATLKDQWDKSKASEAVADAQKSLQNFTLQTQYGGVDPETGQPTPPPPPDQHAELYQKEVDRIRQDAEGKLGGQAMRMFESEFTGMAARQDYTIKKNAIEQYSREIKVSVQSALSKKATNFVEADEIQKPGIQAEAFKQVDALVAQGLIQAPEGAAMKRSFVSEAQGGSVQKLLRTDPDLAIVALERGEFADMPADEQEQWLTRAYRASDKALDRQTRQAEKDQRQAEKDQRDLEEGTGKKLWGMAAKGTLTLDMVEEQEPNLGKDDFKLLMNRATGREGTSTNIKVYADLRVRAGTGENVTAEAKAAALRGDLSEASLNTLLSESETNSPGSTRKNWYKGGSNYITKAMQPAPDSANLLEANESIAKALDTWTDWANDHQGATPEEARKEYEAIVKERRLVDFTEVTANMPMPRMLKDRENMGDRAALEKAAADTKRAYENKEIDKREYARQAKLLNQLKAMAPKPKATTETK